MNTEQSLFQDPIDAKIRAAVQEYVNSMPVADMEEGWRRIEQELYSGNRQRRHERRPLNIALACLAGIILLALVFQIPAVQAWGIRVVLKYQKILPGRVRNYITTISPETSRDLPIHKPLSGQQLRDVVGKLGFAPMVPSQSTAQWTLEWAEVKPYPSGGVFVLLEFKDEEDHTVRLVEQPLRRAHEHSIYYDEKEATLLKHSVRGVDVALLAWRSGKTTAWWYEQDLSLSITCTGDTETALEFIEGLVLYEEEP